ncbi:hypothetical protein [Streptomyces cinerochromogenes]|uniref:hypothetical protein n=1 Tax=Streptomyces cinerochromogenes TaxID=66422 RepID=UPI00167087BA|nr:hypothetical protein [Streptomyces cinerochromogenes]GGT02711.1 hypothetical protein GCM10010206_76670 [Streptomyces cinerochromogenes]
MFVFSAHRATAGAVVAVAAECGIPYPLADRLPAGDAVVIVIVVLAVTAVAVTGHEVPAVLGALAAAAAGRLARARPGSRLDVRRPIVGAL